MILAFSLKSYICQDPIKASRVSFARQVVRRTNSPTAIRWPPVIAIYDAIGDLPPRDTPTTLSLIQKNFKKTSLKSTPP